MIKPAEAFLTKTLRDKPWGKNITRILAAALAAVDPAVVLEQTLQRDGNILVVQEQKFNLDDFTFRLPSFYGAGRVDGADTR